MVQIVQFVALGIAGGILSGLLGIGGAVLLVPALVYLFGFEQHTAQGTTLAMLIPPVGILAAWQYYVKGYVDVKVAALMCIGLFFGGYVGGYIATHISAEVIRRVFGVALFLIALKMIIGR